MSDVRFVQVQKTLCLIVQEIGPTSTNSSTNMLLGITVNTNSVFNSPFLSSRPFLHNNGVMPSLTHPFALFRVLLLPAIAAFLYLYFYPAINDCAFPPAKIVRTKCTGSSCENTTANAGKPPFRLLALADPQLEGDTSLPRGWNNGASNGLGKLWQDARNGDWVELGQDLPVLLQGYRKKLDLWGNDWYLAHIYAQTRWWSDPTHTVVLGDLLGSQWIKDDEFERRVDRFWGTVFGSAARVPDKIMSGKEEREVELQGENDREWRKRIIAVAGNHDVGYAGDLNEKRVERFETAFGKVNWEVRFRLPTNTTRKTDQEFASKKGLDFYDGPGAQPELRLVILNSMNLDEPALKPALRDESLQFMEEHICDTNLWQENSATVLLTHIPLHKASGICVDGPFFSYFPPKNGGGVREQNHLSEDVSRRLHDCLLQGPSVVLNGHDHEGCDTHHYTSPSDGEVRHHQAIHHRAFDTLSAEEKLSSFREITVRSMMGSYGGYAGFLSGWFDEVEGKWQFEYETCGFGVQHIWWACNIVLLLEIGLGVMSGLDVLAQKYLEPERREKVKEA